MPSRLDEAKKSAKDFPHTPEEISKQSLASKLKAAQLKYRHSRCGFKQKWLQKSHATVFSMAREDLALNKFLVEWRQLTLMSQVNQVRKRATGCQTLINSQCSVFLAIALKTLQDLLRHHHWMTAILSSVQVTCLHLLCFVL